MKKLGDASKLLADLHFDDSTIRRKLLIANIDFSKKETLSAITIDKFLFGANLGKIIKSAKEIKNADKEMKKQAVTGVKNEN